MLVDIKAGHASALYAKATELSKQLSEAKSASNCQQERLNANVDELSAKLAAEKRRTASLKVSKLLSGQNLSHAIICIP